jgi:glycosyltransferase involved in cell wall biosynthesis
MKEGWGITNIEANACGTPVISSDVPGLRDSIKKDVSGQLYDYGNIEELADLIYTMLTDDSLRQHFSEGALEWAKSFTWKESAELMIVKCEEVIAEHGENT